jgi:hypothetical protein
MKVYYEWGTKQLIKQGEELCGDSIAITRYSDSVTMALSDGPLGEVVQTLSETLPVDNVRKLAYSTFMIAKFASHGTAKIVEFDSPSVIFLRRRKIQPIVYEERTVEEKKVKEAVLNLDVGDWIIFVSDGVLNAGIGGVYPLGWGWDEAAHFLEEHAHQELTAEDLALRIADTVNELYAGRIGDDVSIAVIKVRHKLGITVFTGPPEDRRHDEEVVERFIKRGGKLVVCGGTTAKIISRYLGRPLEVDLKTITRDVPPIARMEGIDLVSEGILTLTQVSDLLRSGIGKKEVMFRTDGASNLIRLLLDADHIHFIVGHAVNPAHQNPELPNQLGIRLKVVREIEEELRMRGKEVTIEAV